ncbi:cytochrome-c peroxidase [Microbulbifer taiwanensis]|uniref:Cytochrome-c peroxidase n=1 Tax=Microbulbifer taiwanensis TaxID=986746 RepID=A0ABW1YS59_9GAMM|nr:cytochrome c peroxidase [Microbulbifer taiwanensis]
MRRLLLLPLLLWCSLLFASEDSAYRFTQADILFLSRFSLDALPPPPAAPDNAVAEDPRAAALGHRLFFDARLSANGRVSCASCHQPQKYFTDGLPRSLGLKMTRRNAPTVLGASHSPWLFWDGRKDSLWSQALGPLLDPGEHGLDGAAVARVIHRHYRSEYRQLFGDSGDLDRLARAGRRLSDARRAARDRVLSRVGKVIMAYERRLQLRPARFDRFVAQLHRDSGDREALAALMSEEELAGMRLFVGRGNCASCHNGPLFTNYEFHNIGAPEPDVARVDLGRYAGVAALEEDAFTCLSRWSDAGQGDCAEMRFLKRQGPELVGAFKTPTLRNIAQTAPYMQAGQLATLEQVLAHYNAPTPPYYDREQHPSRPHFDILPLGLSDEQLGQVIAFLGTLTSPLPEDDPLWGEPEGL